MMKKHIANSASLLITLVLVLSWTSGCGERTYTIDAATSPVGSGSVSPVGGQYDEGVSVSLLASPASGWIFDHWEGDAAGTSPSLTLVMTSNKQVVACFEEAQTVTYLLGVAISPAGSGSVVPSDGEFEQGFTVSLLALPNTGWVFDRWGGDAVGSSLSIALHMDSDKYVTAIFRGAPLADRMEEMLLQLVDFPTGWYEEGQRDGIWSVGIWSGQRMASRTFSNQTKKEYQQFGIPGRIIVESEVTLFVDEHDAIYELQRRRESRENASARENIELHDLVIGDGGMLTSSWSTDERGIWYNIEVEFTLGRLFLRVYSYGFPLGKMTENGRFDFCNRLARIVETRAKDVVASHSSRILAD